jgi:hypothetical protein
MSELNNFYNELGLLYFVADLTMSENVIKFDFDDRFGVRCHATVEYENRWKMKITLDGARQHWAVDAYFYHNILSTLRHFSFYSSFQSYP